MSPSATYSPLTLSQTTAAALEAQAQQYLEMVKGQQADIAKRDEELEWHNWVLQHTKKYQGCAENLQKLVDTLLVENHKLEANQK